MRYFISISIFVIMFNGCFGDPVKKEETSSNNSSSSDTLTTRNLSHGGNGSESSPFKVGSGIFTIYADDNKSYFTMSTVSSLNSCDIFVYEVSQHFSTNLTSSSSFGQVVGNDYMLYTNISKNTKYDLFADNYSDSAKMGIYSNCLDSTYNYKLPTIKTGNKYSSTDKTVLYEYSALGSESITFEKTTYLSSVVVFTEDFNIVDTIYNAPYTFNLPKSGKYYVFVRGWASGLGFNFKR